MKKIITVIVGVVVLWTGFDSCRVWGKLGDIRKQEQVLKQENSQITQTIQRMSRYPSRKAYSLNQAFKRLVDHRNIIAMYSEGEIELSIPHVKDKQDIHAFSVESELAGVSRIPFELNFSGIKNEVDLGFALQTISSLEKTLDVKIQSVKQSIKNGLTVEGSIYGIDEES
ncbi:MAG: hypothetical protein HQL26_02835 [Candidatus Omnitrophica bacterium]|nr:hypothetical protein [Candidatus Omnitrophota bacterium]